MTVFAGIFIPRAKVSVVKINFIKPVVNSLSMISFSVGKSPAW